MTTTGQESPNDCATPPKAFSVPGPCCITKTPIFSPELSLPTASHMCSPMRSWRTMIVRMSASAAPSMIGLTGYPIRNSTPSRFRISAMALVTFIGVSPEPGWSAGLAVSLRHRGGQRIAARAIRIPGSKPPPSHASGAGPSLPRKRGRAYNSLPCLRGGLGWGLSATASKRLLEDKVALRVRPGDGPTIAAVMPLGLGAGCCGEDGERVAGLAQRVARRLQQPAADALPLVPRRDEQCPDRAVAAVASAKPGDQTVGLLPDP